MENNFGENLRKAAGEVAKKLNDAAQTASEKIGEMRDSQKLAQQIHKLQREKDRCRLTIAELVVRMFDQDAFADALLRPEYNRIKEIDVEIAKLEEERARVGQHEEEAAAGDEPCCQTEEQPAQSSCCEGCCKE